MSEWRRVALETLPELRLIIAAADNPMALWIELHLVFEDAYHNDKRNDDLIGRLFKYARWCVESSREDQFLSDAGTAAVCAFYEHLPLDDTIRCDLPKWLSRQEFIQLRDAFRYHLSEREFEAFEAEFLRMS